MVETPSWPPGWFQDPTGRHDHRWWDGAAWTSHVADAGVASSDPLHDAHGSSGPSTPPAPGPGASPGSSSSRPGPGRPGDGSNDRVAVAALAVGSVGILVALVPGFGLVLPIVAIVLALIARSRIRASHRPGDGMAIAGLVIGIGALLLAGVVTVAAAMLLGGSGGELSAALAEYLACLEVDSPAACRAALEESIARITG